MPGTSEKLITLLEELSAGRPENEKLDLSEYTINKLKDLGYSASIEEALSKTREIFSWRIKDWEYSEIEKKLGW